MKDERRTALANKLTLIIMDDDKVKTTVYDRDNGEDRVLIDYVEIDHVRLQLLIEEFFITQGLEEGGG